MTFYFNKIQIRVWKAKKVPVTLWRTPPPLEYHVLFEWTFVGFETYISLPIKWLQMLTQKVQIFLQELDVEIENIFIWFLSFRDSYKNFTTDKCKQIRRFFNKQMQSNTNQTITMKNSVNAITVIFYQT